MTTRIVRPWDEPPSFNKGGAGAFAPGLAAKWALVATVAFAAGFGAHSMLSAMTTRVQGGRANSDQVRDRSGWHAQGAVLYRPFVRKAATLFIAKPVLKTAKSFRTSRVRTLAAAVVPWLVVALTAGQSSTTWEFVTTTPSVETKKPVPEEPSCCGSRGALGSSVAFATAGAGEGGGVATMP